MHLVPRILFALAAGIALVDLAGAQAARTQVLLEDGRYRIVIATEAGPQVVRSTADPVVGEQVRRVPGSAAVAVTWTEITQSGPVPWSALSLDGATFHPAGPSAHEILLRYAHFDPLASTPEVPPALDAATGGRLWIVQYWTQLLEPYQHAIRGLGATVHLYLPHNANVVEMGGDVAAAVRQLPFVRWVGAYHPAYKLDETLLGEQLQGWSAMKARPVNILAMRRGLEGQNPVAARIRALGGSVDHVNDLGYLMQATLTLGQITDVVRMDEVQWIDMRGPIGTDMDIARQFHGAIYVETFGFDGTGVRAEVLDVGCQTTHPEFTPAPVLHGTQAVNSHGTSTYGINFANGNTAQAKGVLHNAQGISAYYQGYSGGSREAHTAELVNPALSYQAVFQSNSWGDAQITTYTAVSQQMDQIIFTNDFLILQSQSNTGNQTSRPQAWAKNIMSVGGISHFNTLVDTDDTWGGASIGPAADGRIKPDIASFYDNIYTTTTTSTYTTGFGGTSGATPICAGHAGLFFQMWHAGIFNNAPAGTTVFGSRPHYTLAKAFIINTAKQWNFSGAAHNLTRTHQGFGRPDVQKMYDARTKVFFVDETDVLSNLQSTVYNLAVPAGEAEFQATLHWADLPGTTSATQHRINNLDLKVTSPSGTVYWGNNGLLANMFSTAGGTPNTIDTVENVIVQNPAAGTWVVEIIAAQVNQDGHVETPAMDVDYALVVRGIVQGPPPPPPFGIDFSTVPGTGSLHLGVNSIPAGTAEGYCIFSNATANPQGTGNLFGLQADILSIICLTQPAFAGNIFHWTHPVVGLFPDVDFDLPAGAIGFPTGSRTDGTAIAIGAGGVFIQAGGVVRVIW